ncbi:hypothetical protein [Teredinibacter purpureus]|uniref:hypothetical protein n=1 Tax=Teredinibacter purpureus TaxID=2731756 RepID=UPI0005F790E5|nr:hypothetical protein [Teredinibacter purpureus]
MADIHIDDFCRDAAKTLSLLYKKFPQKLIVYVEDIAGPDTPDEFGLHNPRFLAGFHALQWLAETDYIQYSQPIRQEAIEDATLSHRGFTYLSGPDTTAYQTLTEKQLGSPLPHQLPRRIDTLRQTLKSGSSDQLSQLMLRFMSESRQFS